MKTTLTCSFSVMVASSCLGFALALGFVARAAASPSHSSSSSGVVGVVGVVAGVSVWSSQLSTCPSTGST
jgi:hypothetical protein